MELPTALSAAFLVGTVACGLSTALVRATPPSYQTRQVFAFQECENRFVFQAKDRRDVNARMHGREHGIFGTYWVRNGDDRWGVAGMNGIMFPGPQHDDEQDFFRIGGDNVLHNNAYGNVSVEQMSYFVGPPTFLLKQRIVPVVAWVNGERTMRCIGTAFFITCAGHLITASHVILDPIEAGYGEVRVNGTSVELGANLNMGALVPVSGIDGRRGFTFFQMRQARYWGNWVGSPLFNETSRYHGLTDIAIFRVDVAPRTLSHQPLSLSTGQFRLGEQCMTIGYAEMQDIPFETNDRGEITVADPVYNLYASYAKRPLCITTITSSGPFQLQDLALTIEREYPAR